MDILAELKKTLEKNRENLVLSIERAKEARDKAPSAMESHHDTTRNQNEKLVAALESELKEFDRRIEKLPDKLLDNNEVISLWSLVKLKNADNKLSILLVPEGFGGKKLGDITTVTASTPLGMAVLNKTVGENYEINSIVGTVEEIS